MPGASDQGFLAHLRTVGAVLGFEITLTDRDEWEIRDRGLRVGMGWYAQRGYPAAEAEALLVLQLWESVREYRVAPERARRRRTIASVQPELQPLLSVVARLQAVSDVLTAMPGLRAPLQAALRRSLPGDVSAWPRHTQWLALVSAQAGSGTGVHDAWAAALPGVHADVVSEWRGLRSLGTPEVSLAHVLGSDNTRTPLRRMERAIALLLPAYERLLRVDATDPGVSSGSDSVRGAGGADTVDAASEALAGFEKGTSATDDAESQASLSNTSTPHAPHDAATDSARQGSGSRDAEGADLFAAEQAGAIRALLETPLPGGGALLDELTQLAQAHSANARVGLVSPALGAQSGAGEMNRAHATEIAEYRARTEALRAAIERMREVWASVVAERVALRAGDSRQVYPEGETLAREHLASAIAEAESGAPRPRAFHRRELRARRTQDTGNTDYVLLVDRSASMGGAVAEAAADALLIMAEALAGVGRDVSNAEARAGIDLDLDIRSSLIVFDSEAVVVKALSHGLDDETRRAVHAAVRSPRGSTNDAAALRAAAVQLGLVSGQQARGVSDRARRRIVILVSDGGTNDLFAAHDELGRLRAAGVSVHGIGIGSNDVVERYAPSGRRINDPRALAEALCELIADELP